MIKRRWKFYHGFFRRRKMSLSPNELYAEKKYLERVLVLLKQQIQLREYKINSLHKMVTKHKKYMWESISRIDTINIAVNKNIVEVNIGVGDLFQAKVILLKQMLDKPYFGRIDFQDKNFTEPEKIYIGLTGLSDKFTNYIYDWRSPIAGLYYDYELGKVSYQTPSGIISGEIKLKRQYKIEKGILKYAFDSSLNINDEMLQDMLGKSTSNKMRHIVTTIQKEQNKIIRNTTTKILIVEGPAGSGKTSISLHRIAYLLYKHRNENNKLTSNQILIFSPSNIFSDYIGDVLPSLGEENVINTLFADYIHSFITEYKKMESYSNFIERIYINVDQDTKDTIMVKMSNNFKSIIDAYIEEISNKLEFSDIIIKDIVVLKKEQCKKLYSINYKMLPPYMRLEKLIDYGAMKYSHMLERPLRREEIRLIIRSQIIYNNDIKDLLIKMYESPTIKKLIGQKYPTINIQTFCDISIDGLLNTKINYEDAIILLYLKGKLQGFVIDKTIKQVVIDEAQDYNHLQFIIMRNIFPKAHFTILGDPNQGLNPLFEYQTLKEIEAIFLDKETECLKLLYSYRNSYEITRFCNNILDLKKVNLINRHTEDPVVIDTIPNLCNSDFFLQAINDSFSKDYNTTAVITKNKHQMREVKKRLKALGIEYYEHLTNEDNINHKIMVLPIYLAKGLEFDAVIVYDVKEDGFLEDNKKLFYVACSRALHKLYVLSENRIKK